MRTTRYDDDAAPGRTLAARLHKQALEMRHTIRCGHCRYHRGENRTYTSKHSDVRKRHIRWKN